MAPETPHDELKSRLLALAVELTGSSPEQLLDVDGDVQVKDAPFCIFARVAMTLTHPQPRVLFVVVPLLEVRASERLLELVDRTLSGRAEQRNVACNAIQFFCPFPVSVLDGLDAFRNALSSMISLGEAVVAAVQPECGGLTAEQQRVLRGWGGYDAGIEADLRRITEQAGGQLLVHGRNPRSDSLPVIVSEEPDSGREADHFVTVDAKGCVRLRRKVLGERDGVVGFEMTIHELDTDAAREWAKRIGSEVSSGPVTFEELQSLSRREWPELIGAVGDLPHVSGDSWQPVPAGQ